MASNEKNKKTIFVYIYGYLPAMNYGGPVTSIYNFVNQFGDDYDIRIVCSNHEHGKKEILNGISEGWNKVGKANVYYLSEKQYTWKLFSELMSPFTVCMVYLTGVFSYKLNHAAIKSSRIIGVKPIIAIRGEICVNVLKMKAYKKIPYLFLMRKIHEYKDVIFQVTSDEEKIQLIKYLGVNENKIVFLPNISFVSFDYKSRNKKEGEARFIFISRIHPKKNLMDAIKAINRSDGKVLFDIFGPIEDEKYWNQCKIEISNAPSNVKINYMGALDMMDAKRIFNNYHFFVFPTLTENYGHVIAESLICNCPVILSKGTTPWDDVNEIAGYTVILHDIADLTKKINDGIDMNQEDYDKLVNNIEKYIITKFDYEKIIKGYKSLINNFEGNCNELY